VKWRTIGPRRSRRPGCRPGIPAYFYPWPDSAHWRSVGQLEPGAIVVMNPDNGPGVAVDPNYERVVEAARQAGCLVYGYVDTAYGRRAPDVIAAEARLHEQWYGVVGVFLDQTAPGPEHLEYYRRITHGLREAGLHVALNPGQPLFDLGYLDLADQVVVFEGSYGQYVTTPFPRWLLRRPRASLWHLVYAVATAEAFHQVMGLAEQRNAGRLFVTDGHLPNPWDRLPSYWSEQATLLADRAESR